MQSTDGKDYLPYTSASKRAKSACRSAVTNMEKNNAHNAKKNLKVFFAYDKTKTRTLEGVADSKGGERKVSSDKGQANVLNSFFKSVSTDEDLMPVSFISHFGTSLSYEQSEKSRTQSMGYRRLRGDMIETSKFTLRRGSLE